MTESEFGREKQNVALLSLFASLGLAVVKFAAALASGSLGMLSEAFHSMLDCGATGLTLFAIRVSEKPADDEHHYGHAKVESVAALVETGLLFLVTFWVAYEAVSRLWSGSSHVKISWWLFVILIASIVIDFNRYRALAATAKRSNSDALAADALHFQADMWSSFAVMCGLGAVALGFPYGDAAAALVVAIFVGKAGLDLGRRTLNTLLDAAPLGTTEQLRTLIENTDGVLSVSQLRVRPAGPILFVDVQVEVARTLAIGSVEAIRSDIVKDIRGQFAQVDVTIQTIPVALDGETAFDKVSLVAAQHGLSVHHLVVQDLGGKLAVSFDLEVDGETALFDAHVKATRLESDIRDGLGGNVEVESHIEPASAKLMAGEPCPSKLSQPIERALASLCKKEKALVDLHNIRIRQNTTGIYVHYHCRFKYDMTIEAVHAVIDRIEIALCDKIPAIKRVVAHAEPIGQVRHKL